MIITFVYGANTTKLQTITVYTTFYRTHIIAVAADIRDKWVSPVKLYCFWKLRVKGYTAADTDTMTYIIAEVKNAIVHVSEEVLLQNCPYW